MNCFRCREALSALADGEDPGLARHRVDQHLRTCAGCRTFSAGIGSIAAMSGDSGVAQLGEPTLDLTSRIVARLNAEHAVNSPGPTTIRPARATVSIWRVGLIALAIGQFLAALPALAGSSNAVALHANHDLGAVELALSASFLLAAIRPWRAAGLIPLLAAVVGFLAIVAGADVASGRIAASSELPHLVDVLGLVMLIAVARRQPAPALQARLA